MRKKEQSFPTVIEVMIACLVLAVGALVFLWFTRRHW